MTFRPPPRYRSAGFLRPPVLVRAPAPAAPPSEEPAAPAKAWVDPFEVDCLPKPPPEPAAPEPEPAAPPSPEPAAPPSPEPEPAAPPSPEPEPEPAAAVPPSPELCGEEFELI